MRGKGTLNTEGPRWVQHMSPIPPTLRPLASLWPPEPLLSKSHPPGTQRLHLLAGLPSANPLTLTPPPSPLSLVSYLEAQTLLSPQRPPLFSLTAAPLDPPPYSHRLGEQDTP